MFVRVILSGGADAVIRTYPVERLSVFGVLRDSAAASGVATIDTQVGEDWINEEIPVDKSIEINERSVTCLAANHVPFIASNFSIVHSIIFTSTRRNILPREVKMASASYSPTQVASMFVI